MHCSFECIYTRNSTTQGQGGPGRGGNQGSGGGGLGPRFKVTCHGCGMRVQMGKYLWEDAANSRKRPEGWKSRNNVEESLITHNVNEKYATEYICMTVGAIKNLKFTNDLKLLKYRNVMISDSGMTCDSTPHESGIKLIRNENLGDSIINASGDEMAVKYAGNMHVSKCNNKIKAIQICT